MGKTISIYLTDSAVAWLDDKCIKSNMSRSKFIEFCIQQSANFSPQLTDILEGLIDNLKMAKSDLKNIELGDESKK
jgi:Ribbon-helix-helix protein, copG family.